VDTKAWGTTHQAAPQAQDMICRWVKNDKGCVNEDEKRKNHTKSRVRAR